MTKYYFFSFMKYLSEHKKFQAALITLGGILTIVFAPYCVGLMTQSYLGVSCSPAWWSGTVVLVVIGLLARIAYVIYTCVLDKLEKGRG